VKLDESKMGYIVRVKERGERSSNVAIYLGVSRRRVEQVYAYYRKYGEIPLLGKPGRKTIPISEAECSIILDAYGKYRVNALYLKDRIEKDFSTHINHDRIQKVLKMYGLSSEPAKRWIRRKWFRYEREYANSLWHVDWYEVKDPRWKGMQLILYEDDASRFTVGYGLFKDATSKNSVEVLKEAIVKYGKPKSILSDRGVQFYAVEADAREKGLTEFEVFLMRNHIRHILGRVSHPQTNGKIEKLFDEVGRKIKFFNSIDECIDWYNTIKPHGALNLKTPIEAYYQKMPQSDILMDPFILIREAS
jgi:putative transposase